MPLADDTELPFRQSPCKSAPDLAHCINRGFIYISKSKHKLKHQTVCYHLHCLMASLLPGLHLGLCLLAPAWESSDIIWVRACARLVPFISLWANLVSDSAHGRALCMARDKAQGYFFYISVWPHPSLCKAPWTRFCMVSTAIHLRTLCCNTENEGDYRINIHPEGNGGCWAFQWDQTCMFCACDWEDRRSG